MCVCVYLEYDSRPASAHSVLAATTPPPPPVIQDVFSSPLEDKDSLVTFVRKCGATSFIVPSTLLPYDFHLSVKGDLDLPSVPAVLKTPLGSCGNGVHFVFNSEEVLKLVSMNYDRASAPGLLEEIQAQKGRIPEWVLQKEVRSKLLDGKKFHLRAYVLAVEEESGDLGVYLYIKDYEVRIASETIDEWGGNNTERPRAAHLTNGASSAPTRRCLLSNIPSIESAQLESFVAGFFQKLRTSMNAYKSNDGCCHFGLSGVDIMVDEDGDMAVLEVNAYPAAPPEDDLVGDYEGMLFHEHLIQLGKSVFGFLRLKSEERGERGDFINVDEIECVL